MKTTRQTYQMTLEVDSDTIMNWERIEQYYDSPQIAFKSLVEERLKKKIIPEIWINGRPMSELTKEQDE